MYHHSTHKLQQCKEKFDHVIRETLENILHVRLVLGASIYQHVWNISVWDFNFCLFIIVRSSSISISRLAKKNAIL